MPEFRANSKHFRDALRNALKDHLELNKLEISNTHELLKSLEHKRTLSINERALLIAARTICRSREAATVLGFLITGRTKNSYGENFRGILWEM